MSTQDEKYSRTITLLLILFFLGMLFGAKAHAGFWRRFCERNIIAADPYQYAHLTPEQLVQVHINFREANHTSQVLENEMRYRLKGTLTEEQRENLTRALRISSRANALSHVD